MTDLRSRILARLDEWLALCEAARRAGTSGLAVTWIVQQAGDYGRWVEQAEVAFPATLRALRREVVKHKSWLAQRSCSSCDPGAEGLGDWPCRRLRRIAADLGIEGE